MKVQKNTKAVGGYRLILGYLGIVFILVGCILLLPLLVLSFYPEDVIYAKNFILPGVCSIFMGYMLYGMIRGRVRGKLYEHQDAVIVVFTWIIAIILSSIPFMLTGEYTFTQAVFECTSGYSTTGLSIFKIDGGAHIYFMFRSIMLFFGGVGLVLVVTIVMSDFHGARLYGAEGHADKLLPNFIRSAKLIVLIYSGYILGGTILYTLAGMEVFDSLNHAISALSTGGFSTKIENIAYYKSAPIELISITLMLLGEMNFAVHLLLLRGKFKNVWKHCETHFSFALISVMVPIFAYILMRQFALNLSEGIRAALFQIVSALSTTGFQSVPTFQNWSSVLKLLLIVLMLIGGGAGSTAGGIKQIRAYIGLKEAWWNLKARFANKRVVRINHIYHCDKKEMIREKEKLNNMNFILLYMLVFFAGTLIYCCFGFSVEDSMFEFSSALGTVGLSVGITGYDAHPAILWTGTVGMFMGRLELYIVVLSFMRIGKDSLRFLKQKRYRR